MEVVEPLIPVPVDVILPCDKAHRLRNVEVEHIDVAGPTVHLDEEASMMVLDAKHFALDLHLGSTFIKLSKAHDGVVQRWFEVDTMKNVMLAVFGLGHDQANALYLHPGRIARLHQAMHRGVEVGE